MFYMNFFLSLSRNMESVCLSDGWVCLSYRAGSDITSQVITQAQVNVAVNRVSDIRAGPQELWPQLSLFPEVPGLNEFMVVVTW